MLKIKLDLPYEHDVIGYVSAANRMFVVVVRDDTGAPFASYSVGVPDRSMLEKGLYPCYRGHYTESREAAFADMYQRATQAMGN